MRVPTSLRVAITTVAGVVGSALLAVPASADQTFTTTRYPLFPVGGAPLQQGAVVDIHAEGPQIYAQERYHLSGALPSTEYVVTLNIYLDPSCTDFVAALETDTLLTNPAGNANGSATFTPADAAPLAQVQSEYGIVWEVSGPTGVAYTTGCQVVPLD
ncbi:hypothetical protein ACI797_15365 [Geodermatophilus sp. SYSU D00691]